MFTQRDRTSFQDEGQGCESHTPIRCLAFQLFSEALHVADVRIVKLGHMRNIQPGTHHVVGGDLVDPAAARFLNRTKARIVLLGNRGQARPT